MRTPKTALVLFAFWCVIVAPETPLDVVVGLAASALLAVWAARFLGPHAPPLFSALALERWPAFLIAHAWRMFTSAVHVLRVVLDPRLPITPQLVTQTVDFDREAARVAYANALTVTPGSLTVDVDGDTFVVHCLDAEFAGDVRSGALARAMERLFGARPSAPAPARRGGRS